MVDHARKPPTQGRKIVAVAIVVMNSLGRIKSNLAMRVVYQFGDFPVSDRYRVQQFILIPHYYT